MSTITAILEADADGTLHLTAPPEMIERRKAALAEVRRLDPYRAITDPVAWQRDIRQDRPLPGRG